MTQTTHRDKQYLDSIPCLPLSPLVPGCAYSSFEETVLKDGFWIVLEQIANKTTSSGIPRDKKNPGGEEESS